MVKNDEKKVVEPKKAVVHNKEEEKKITSIRENLSDGIYNTHTFVEFMLNENKGEPCSFDAYVYLRRNFGLLSQ